jgi:hypothetical protein
MPAKITITQIADAHFDGALDVREVEVHFKPETPLTIKGQLVSPYFTVEKQHPWAGHLLSAYQDKKAIKVNDAVFSIEAYSELGSFYTFGLKPLN